MAETATRPPETVRLDEAKSSGTGVGPGRPSKRPTKPGLKVALLVLGLAVVVISVLLYRYFAALESTDDAQIDGYIYPVSSRIPGYVTRVTVDDNQYVEAGTVLVQLDPKDFEIAVTNAQATLANGRASAAAVGTNVPITSVSTSTQLSSAEAGTENAKPG